MSLDASPTTSEGVRHAHVPAPGGPRGLHLSILDEGEATVVVLVGELDHLSATSLRTELELLARMTRRVVLDMRGVEFLDSAGIGAIAGAHSAMRNDFCDLTIRNPSSAARRVLEISGASTQVLVLD